MTDSIETVRSLGYRATPCRCGISHNKPYIGGTHQKIGFKAD